MSIRGRAVRWIEKLSNGKLIVNLPRGYNLFYDIQNYLPDYSMDYIFDIGANIGQSVLSYHKTFPTAKVFCLEPIQSSYDILCQRTRGIDEIKCYRLALGDSVQEARMISEGTSTTNRLFLGDGIDSKENLEQIKIITFDQFRHDRKIENIPFVKIDTEGAELAVLQGASEALGKHRIGLIEVEAGINPDNKRHVPYQELVDYLRTYGYLLFGIYAQMNNWRAMEPHLRRVNAVFISTTIVDRYRGISGKQFD